MIQDKKRMKKIIQASFMVLAGCLGAQSLGNSPYAAFGIGDIKYDHPADVSAMAGISTAHVWDFNNIYNFNNPAANGNFDLTSFKIQVNNENQFFKSDYNQLDVTKHSTYLSNISLAFPIAKKVKFGLAYQPFSSKKYNILKTTTKAGDLTQANSFSGEGSINMIQGALGYQITPSFGVGVRTNFYFGKISDIEEIAISDTELVNGFETSRKIKSWNFTTGATYQHRLGNDRKLTLGGTYTFGKVGKTDNQYINSTYYYIGKEKVNKSIIETKDYTQENVIPQKASFGVGYGQEAKWFVSTQLDYTNGGKIEFNGLPVNFNDSYRVAVGGWYLPNYNNFRNVFSRIIYRYGAYYEKGNLTINNHNINEFGLTFGATVPFQNNSVLKMSGIDFGLEIGKRGTSKDQLVSERFINFKVGLNFADKWFNKRQYD